MVRMFINFVLFKQSAYFTTTDMCMSSKVNEYDVPKQSVGWILANIKTLRIELDLDIRKRG